jgi:hypothetical protein
VIYVPTPAEIIDEIEKGPLAAELAPYWATVFVAPVEAKPTSPERVGSWEVKTRRAGRLHPDAAHEIHRRLTTGVPNRKDTPAVPSRAEALEWIISRKDVQRAHATPRR